MSFSIGVYLLTFGSPVLIILLVYLYWTNLFNKISVEEKKSMDV